MKHLKPALVAWALSVGAAFAGPQGFALHDAPQPVINVRYLTEDGSRGDMEGFRGKVILVNVWATWCVPCRVEMPLLVDLAETGTVPIYGINHRDPPEAALAFLRELGDPYTRIGADRNGRVSIDWGVYGLPETFVIDSDGRIAYKHVGPFDRRALDEEILPVVRRLQAGDGS